MTQGSAPEELHGFAPGDPSLCGLPPMSTDDQCNGSHSSNPRHTIINMFDFLFLLNMYFLSSLYLVNDLPILDD